MKKLYISLISSLFVVSTWAIAEEVELLDTYLEELPSTSQASNQNIDSATIVGQPVDIVVDENGKSHEVVRPQAVEYRRIETADGSEVYEEVPVKSATPAAATTSDYQVITEAEVNPGVVTNKDVPVQSSQDLEIIELEPDDGEFVVIEAPENQSTQTVATTNSTAVSGHGFCQQNPYARECTLSKYLSLCEKDPQSTDCKNQLQMFDNFCGTFPNAYKCKKAKIAATCQKDPSSSQCKTFTQRYCQKYPKAIFCNYN